MKASAFVQQSVLMSALLRAGMHVGVAGSRDFRTVNVGFSRKRSIVVLCDVTQATIACISVPDERNAASADAYHPAVFGDCDVPNETGRYAVTGTVRVGATLPDGRTQLVIRITGYEKEKSSHVPQRQPRQRENRLSAMLA